MKNLLSVIYGDRCLSLVVRIMFLTWILKTGSEPIRKVISIFPVYFPIFRVNFKYGF